MTEADREYLRAVRNNFILYVENITNHCLKVEIDLYFIDDVTPLTRWEGDDWLYLKRDTVLGKVREYDEKKTGGYDTVITFVETEGAGNESRNRNKPGYGVHYVMLGLMTHGLRDDIGYSTVSLGQPDPQYYPQPDPAAPTLMGTAVAVHEWLHQLEYLGEVMGVEYPNTHAYTGEYPGYRKYLHNEKQFDQFEFYSLVLQGKLPYTKDGKTRLVGMYPRMWKLAKRNALNLGKYYIGNGKGMYLTPGNVEPYVILSEFKIPWLLRYGPDGRVIIHPWQPPYLPEDWRLDLDNAYDADGTWVKIIYNTGWLDAQSWYLTKNSEEFHAHLGYSLVGKFQNCGYKFGRWYHMIWMEKIVGEHQKDQPPIRKYGV